MVLPLVAVIAGLIFYLNGGRYVTTDDAYVGAQKVLITPDISGKIDKVVVREGQHVNQGDVLFEIDPVPFRLALQQAKAAVDQSKTTYDNLIANIKIYDQMADLMQQTIDLKKRTSIANRRSPRTITARSSISTMLPTAWSPRVPSGPSCSSSFPARRPSCSAMPICRLRNSRPISG